MSEVIYDSILTKCVISGSYEASNQQLMLLWERR